MIPTCTFYVVQSKHREAQRLYYECSVERLNLRKHTRTEVSMRKRRARRTCVEPQSRGLHVDVLGLLGVLRKPSSDNVRVSQLLAIHAVTVCSVPVAVPTTVGSARGSASGSGSGN